MKEIDYIYSLCIKGGLPFYVGRTNDLARRMGEHRRAAAAGDTETKYQVIRDILAGGDEWEYVVLAEVDSDEQPYEDFWVYTLLCEGYPLANMKAGDARKQAEEDAMGAMRGRGERFSEPKAFLDARAREIAEAKARAATAKLAGRVGAQKPLDDGLSTLFSFEKPQDRFMSPWMKKRKAQGAVHRGPQR